MGSGTRISSVPSLPGQRRRVRPALRLAGLALASALAVGLSPATAAAAPGDGRIAEAQAQADAVAARIAALGAELAAAQDTVDAAHAASAIALDTYQVTQAEYEAAQTRADLAAEGARQATAALGAARDEIIAFARRSYMEGSTFSGAAALVTAADPGELIQRAALLEAAGLHRSDVLVTVTALQRQATASEALARDAHVEAAALQEQSAAALAVAQSAEVAAREQAAGLESQQAALQTELAAAQEELRDLVGAQEAADRTPPAAPAPAPPPAPPVTGRPAGTGDAGAAQTAIDAAMAQLGLPYAWGGGGSRGPGPGIPPDEGVVGFDCSGLTQYAYARAGISIPRNSRAQYTALPKVGTGDLRPGDLVFWANDPANPSTIYHVAIWLGNDRVVQAPESGDVVKVSAMWWKGYAGAVRPTA